MSRDVYRCQVDKPKFRRSSVGLTLSLWDWLYWFEIDSQIVQSRDFVTRSLELVVTARCRSLWSFAMRFIPSPGVAVSWSHMGLLRVSSRFVTPRAWYVSLISFDFVSCYLMLFDRFLFWHCHTAERNVQVSEFALDGVRASHALSRGQ